MSAEPVVSVIIASHNAVTTIGQTARGQCEIIVADSSTDGTGAFVKEHFPGARLLEFSSRKFSFLDPCTNPKMGDPG